MHQCQVLIDFKMMITQVFESPNMIKVKELHQKLL